MGVRSYVATAVSPRRDDGVVEGVREEREEKDERRRVKRTEKRATAGREDKRAR